MERESEIKKKKQKKQPFYISGLPPCFWNLTLSKNISCRMGYKSGDVRNKTVKMGNEDGQLSRVFTRTMKRPASYRTAPGKMCSFVCVFHLNESKQTYTQFSFLIIKIINSQMFNPQINSLIKKKSQKMSSLENAPHFEIHNEAFYVVTHMNTKHFY